MLRDPYGVAENLVASDAIYGLVDVDVRIAERSMVCFWLSLESWSPRSTPEDVKHERLGGTEIGGPMASERTGKKAASNAGRTLGVKKATKAAKSASGSALSQTKSSGVTGKKAASSAGATLGAKKSTKAAKSAAGSTLTQKPTKKARTS